MKLNRTRPTILSTVALLTMAGLLAAAAPSALRAQEEDDDRSSAREAAEPQPGEDEAIPEPPQDPADRSEDDIPTPPDATLDQEDRQEQQRQQQQQRDQQQRDQQQRDQQQRDQQQREDQQRDQRRDQDPRFEDREGPRFEEDRALDDRRRRDDQPRFRDDRDIREDDRAFREEDRGRRDDRGFRPQGGQIDERDLGVQFQMQDDRLVVEQLNRGILASSGLRQGDIILQVAGRPIADQREFTRWIATAQPGQRLPIIVWRDGARETIYVQPGPQWDARRGQDDYAQRRYRPDADAWLGVYLDDRYRNQAVVEYVVPGSAADEAGVQSGDVILRASGQRISSADELRALTSRMRPGQPLDLEVTRPRTLRLDAVLKERPDTLGQARYFDDDRRYDGRDQPQLRGPQYQGDVDARGFGGRIDNRNESFYRGPYDGAPRRDGAFDGDRRGPLRELFD